MALICTCPITGFSFKLTDYGSGHSQVYKLTTKHPLLHCTLGELNKLPVSTSIEENSYLFTAYLWHANDHTLADILDFRSPLTPERFTKLWLLQQLPRIRQLVNWLALNSGSQAVAKLPGLRITSNTAQDSLQSWLDSCFEVKAEYVRVTPKGDTATKLLQANLNRWSDPEISDGHDKVIYHRNRTRKEYIARSLQGHTPQRIDLITKVIFRAQEFEVSTIKQVKLFCLDFLLESSLDEFNEKQEIIRKLDSTLSGKVSILEALEHSSSAELRKELTEQYTIIHDGKEYPNNVLDLPQRPEFTSKLITAKPKHTVPETEPKRADYTSELRWQVAYRVWKRAQTGG